jgi:hypothetical protein
MVQAYWQGGGMTHAIVIALYIVAAIFLVAVLCTRSFDIQDNRDGTASTVRPKAGTYLIATGVVIGLAGSVLSSVAR